LTEQYNNLLICPWLCYRQQAKQPTIHKQGKSST
jgi:hypothetical protein